MALYYMKKIVSSIFPLFLTWNIFSSMSIVLKIYSTALCRCEPLPDGRFYIEVKKLTGFFALFMIISVDVVLEFKNLLLLSLFEKGKFFFSFLPYQIKSHIESILNYTDLHYKAKNLYLSCCWLCALFSYGLEKFKHVGLCSYILMIQKSNLLKLQLLLVELFKLRVCVHGFSHFTFRHSWIGYLVLIVQWYFQSSLEISIEIDSFLYFFYL